MEGRPPSPTFLADRRESSEMNTTAIGNSVNFAIAVDNILGKIHILLHKFSRLR
jgi:hypothetical protein